MGLYSISVIYHLDCEIHIAFIIKKSLYSSFENPSFCFSILNVIWGPLPSMTRKTRAVILERGLSMSSAVFSSLK